MLPWLLLLVIAAAITLAGCGRSEESRSLSKREYIEQGNRLQQDAAEVFRELDGGRTVASPKTAATQLAALDRLVTGFGELRPPRDWRDEHATLVESLRTMRSSLAIVSRASARNARVITLQLQRYADAQRDFEQAIRKINASR